MRMQQAAEQVSNTPLADFSIGLCLFLAAFVIVLFFKDEPRRGASPKNPVELDTEYAETRYK